MMFGYIMNGWNCWREKPLLTGLSGQSVRLQGTLGIRGQNQGYRRQDKVRNSTVRLSKGLPAALICSLTVNPETHACPVILMSYWAHTETDQMELVLTWWALFPKQLLGQLFWGELVASLWKGQSCSHRNIQCVAGSFQIAERRK